MDRIRIIPERLNLTDEAAHSITTVEPFTRRVKGRGKHRPEALILSLCLGLYDFLRIICHRLDSGNWRVSCIDANLPAHVYGHNGRPIRTDDELALALSRLQHFVSLVTRPECHGRIIPGDGNLGFLRYAECTIQIQDPEHRLLVGSHVASQHYQHGRPLVVWHESTTFKGRELGFTFYDKFRHRKTGVLDPEGIDNTRIECLVKNGKRLAKEVKATRAFTGSPGQVVSTLSLRTAYLVLRQNLARMSGYGSIVGKLDPGALKTAKLLLMGLGQRLDEPHAIDLVLENYRRAFSPVGSTFKTVSRMVREHAHAFVAPNALALVPPDLADLQWSDVRMPQTEKDFGVLCRDLGAPAVPCPMILAAWSRTTFLKSKPAGSDLSGPYTPAPFMPWRQTL